jgi:hypothetical protein
MSGSGFGTKSGICEPRSLHATASPSITQEGKCRRVSGKRSAHASNSISRHSWTRRRNSSKRSAKAAELVSESVAGAVRVTGPSSTLKVVCNIPVLGCIGGIECLVRAAAGVAGFTAVLRGLGLS